MKTAKTWYTSKKFWLAVTSIATAIVTACFPAIPTVTYNAILAGIGALNIALMTLDGTLKK